MKNNKSPIFNTSLLAVTLCLAAGNAYCQSIASDDQYMKTMASHIDNDPSKPLCAADSMTIDQKAQDRTNEMKQNLNLTEEQVQAVSRINFDYMKQLFRLNSAPMSQQAHTDKLNDVAAAHIHSLKTILTAEQQEKLKTSTN